MLDNRSHYIAYMLRLWQAGSEDAPVWRASLESTRTGERLVFANLDTLFAFLRDHSTLSHDQDAFGANPSHDPVAPSSCP